MVGLSLRFKKNREATLEINLVDKWRGRGFGTEVMLWLVSYAFQQLALHRLSLGVLAGNSPAIAVYKKVGFVEEGRSRKSNWQDGKWQDVVYMGLLEEEWLASAQQA
ncbi:acyl-CoA N-acyltransferase [Punctularia strigosozonata HHB-11173 SS5]|uniref:acyl-CoA N-acyltransferase n=1 Tax=Punctularia strigosozonata (strain HHB-11173) TaxID=741275 RepID=UPI0004417FD4|nr:acyl-CoA N-acyltransferase [Punctularia strigosozonata HHB-11173 SS5]EIN12903.1 acyl-CoA N-acyltransferase [Punctularia strigosozonata HHB-11173 SS5]